MELYKTGVSAVVKVAKIDVISTAVLLEIPLYNARCAMLWNGSITIRPAVTDATISGVTIPKAV